MSLPIKLGALALAGFALLALIMASTGLYGTVSYAVSQRTREVGIRLSLGASRSEVVRLLLGSGLKLVAGGVVIGLLAALMLARLLQGLLFGVKAIDPLTFAAVPAVLLSVAFLAAWLPARRAGRVDPQVALRSE
jgi:ABC-type antimicrobial peptide transport system permease subunit